MNELIDALRRLLSGFGRPAADGGADAHDVEVDGRLTALEQRQAEIKARLRILEKQGNPRGIGRD